MCLPASLCLLVIPKGTDRHLAVHSLFGAKGSPCPFILQHRPQGTAPTCRVPAEAMAAKALSGAAARPAPAATALGSMLIVVCMLPLLADVGSPGPCPLLPAAVSCPGACSCGAEEIGEGALLALVWPLPLPRLLPACAQKEELTAGTEERPRGRGAGAGGGAARGTSAEARLPWRLSCGQKRGFHWCGFRSAALEAFPWDNIEGAIGVGSGQAPCAF